MSYEDVPCGQTPLQFVSKYVMEIVPLITTIFLLGGGFTIEKFERNYPEPEQSGFL